VNFQLSQNTEKSLRDYSFSWLVKVNDKHMRDVHFEFRKRETNIMTRDVGGLPQSVQAHEIIFPQIKVCQNFIFFGPCVFV
jgi:hypothetical protein